MKYKNDMLYLCLCAINGEKPDKSYVSKIDLDVLFRECQRHSVTALVCYALETVLDLPFVWKEAKGKAVRKNMLFDIERQKITDFMSKNGIRYMPLKGIILKEYYPKIGMREMSDNDIFYDSYFREQLKDFMLSIGYECTSQADDHDIYEKQPMYNFEMHHAVFLQEASEELCNYYIDIEERMLKDDENSCSYHLNDEDFYIYLIAHEYKHYIHSGTGIRSFLDCIVFLKKCGDTLDWKYIEKETEKAGLSFFEKNQRALCKKLSVFSYEYDLFQDEIDFLEYLTLCGAHGTFSISVFNKAKGTAFSDGKINFSKRLRYIAKRLFPPMGYYKRFYPFFYRHKYLIPLCFLYRLYLALFKRRKRIKSEIEILNKI